MVLLCKILFNLAIAVIAAANLMQISAEQVPSLHRIAPRYLKLVTSSYTNIYTDVVRATSHDLALFCVDYYSICRCSVGEVLKFIIAAAPP